MRDLSSGPGIKPGPPALGGRALATGPPGKSALGHFDLLLPTGKMSSKDPGEYCLLGPRSALTE